MNRLVAVCDGTTVPSLFPLPRDARRELVLAQCRSDADVDRYRRWRRVGIGVQLVVLAVYVAVVVVLFDRFEVGFALMIAAVSSTVELHNQWLIHAHLRRMVAA